MANYLKIIYEESLDKTAASAITDNSNNYEYRNKPFANSPVYNACVQSFEPLTQGMDVKTVYQLKFGVENIRFDFLPGDVIAILPENDDKEVKELLRRLSLEDVCHKNYCLEVLENTSKKNARVPKHLPQRATLYNVFLKYVDIRTIPKKLFLKNLIKYTKDSLERDELELICSPSGSDKYMKLLENNRSLLSLLNSFPSCHPPIDMILENSNPLNPRYFSIASSPLSNQLCIVFYILEMGDGLKGVCSGWLERIINARDFSTKAIPMYIRTPGNFRLNSLRTPSILVATGTGLAPFLSFLRHKRCMLTSNPSLATTWLFYGCRYSTRDFLCQEELKSYLGDGVLTKLYTAFSREGERKEYVQHMILECKKEVVDLILNQEANVFICGDAKTVVKDVKESIIKCLMECRNINRTSAEGILNNSIFVDSWI